MSNTETTDSLLVGGTNQGIDRSVLPMPQVSLAFNVRMRKGSRWGKRYGHTALSTTNLGSGPGLNRCVGKSASGAFAVVDDICCAYDESAAAFVSPALIAGNQGLVPLSPRIPGAISGWRPDTSFFPVPARSLSNQVSTQCATCFGLGYLWTAIAFLDPANPSTDTSIRVVATDPVDQTVVYVQDVVAAIATFGGVFLPRLLACGSTVVLTYMYTSAAGTTAVMGRRLTSLGSGFGAETSLAAGITGYDASVYSSTQFLVAATKTAAVGNVQLFTAATFVQTALQNLAGVAISVSVVGVATDKIYVGYGTAAPATSVDVFTPGLAGLTGTAALSAGLNARPLMALLPSGSGARVVYGIQQSVPSVTVGKFLVRDVFPGATVGAALAWNGLYPISAPFAAGASMYIWMRLEVSSGLPSPAVLVSLLGSSASTPTLEMSVQDYLVPLPQLAGLSAVSRIGTTASFAVVMPILYTSTSPVSQPSYDFRVLQAKHYSDAAESRSVNALYADSRAFIPGGTLASVGSRGVNEEGFLHAPGLVASASGSAGSLTPSSTYYYSALYKARGANGRFEVSGVSTPVKVTLGAGQSAATVNVDGLALTARANVQIEIYRTLANGQTYYLQNVVDAVSPNSSGYVVTYTDIASDITLASSAALYTQVGQTLPNTLPPPSRFGCVGGQRIWLAGQIRSDLVQASKLVFGDQSPSFADSDAFRIVLPQPCTGLAWMDVLTMFTAEGIYIASGDGPDDSGNGDFGNLTRMPYEIGCIEPRSVKVVDDGCFFQTARGLYLLPRGFGAPVPAGDNVMDSLAQFPVITGVATVTKAQEQSVVWTCSNVGATQGVRIVYDLAHKVWSVDNFADSSGASAAPCGIGQWAGGEIAQFATTVAGGLQASNSAYSDANNTPIQMQIRTGDLRPFGVLSEGAINKVDLLAEVRSSCAMNVTKTTELGTFASQRVFALAAGDYQIGDISVTETELGAQEFRDAMSVRVQYDETSTGEGVAFIALSLEHEQGEGLKRATNLSRNT